MRKLVALAASAAVCTLVVAQSNTLAQDAAPSADTDLQPALQQFLAKKSAAQSLRSARIAERGKENEAREIERMLRALGMTAPKPGETVSEAQSQALKDSLTTEAVQLLVFVGMTPGRINQLQSAGTTPLEVAIRYLQGRGSLTDQALLGDRTVLAELSSLKTEDLGDGYGSTAVFRVSKNLVGAGPPSISIRQRSGMKEGGDTITFSNDFKDSDVGNTYLITSSEGLYDEGTAVKRSRPAEIRGGADRMQVTLGTQYLVQDGTAVPVYGVGQPIPISSLDQEFANLKQAKGRASASGGQ